MQGNSIISSVPSVHCFYPVLQENLLFFPWAKFVLAFIRLLGIFFKQFCLFLSLVYWNQSPSYWSIWSNVHKLLPFKSFNLCNAHYLKTTKLVVHILNDEKRKIFPKSFFFSLRYYLPLFPLAWRKCIFSSALSVTHFLHFFIAVTLGNKYSFLSAFLTFFSKYFLSGIFPFAVHAFSKLSRYHEPSCVRVFLVL